MASRGVDVTVASAGHDVADARLHREVAALQRAGLKVEVLGLGSASDGPDGAEVRTWPRGGLASRALLAVRLPWIARGHVLIALDPDVLAGAAPARLVRRCRLVADVHEDYGHLLEDRSWATGPVGAVAGWLARRATGWAARADLTTVADHHVPPLAARRRVVLRNLPDPAFLPAVAEPDPAPRAVYVGDVRTSRGVFTMLDALRAAPRWTLDIVGPVAPSDQGSLEAALCEGDLATRVRVHGRMPPADAWAVAAGAWAGLLLLDDTPAFRRAVPSKLFEYLSCGLAVVTTPLPRQAAIVRESGAGVVVASAREAGEVLEAWVDDRSSLERHRTAAAQWAAERLAVASEYDTWAREVRDVARTAS